jgi:hypothetical protein
VKVTALKPGFFGKLRAPGDEFDVPDGTRATWFAPALVVGDVPRGKPPAGKAASRATGKPPGDDLV